MNIDYVLLAHGIGRKSEGGKITYESVKNLTSQSINNGADILVTWQNPAVEEFVKVELFASETDLTNLDYEQTVLAATKVLDGTDETYIHPAIIGVTYYFKAFVTYFTFGNNVISKGATTFIIASDTTPPAPITNFVASGDNESVNLSWTNPTDEDFSKVKIVYKAENYPTSHTDGNVAYEGSGTNVTVTGLTNDVEYFFRAFTFDTSNNINNDESQKVSAVPSEVKIYGVKIDETNSNPETAVTYTDDAVGFTPASGNNGNFDYGSWENIYPFNQIKPCVLKDGEVQYYLDPNDYTKKIDGSSADITSGNDGDVMVEFPKIWWKFETIGNDLYVRYATKQVDHTWKCYAHTRGNEERDYVYISAYMGYEQSGKLRSLSGKTPTANKTIGAFRTIAQANGSGYEQMTYHALLMLQILFLIMFKSRDSQTALGRGYVDGNSSYAITGGTDKKGMFYGETTGKLQNKFCGIEDFWGNTFYWIDGVATDSNYNILINNKNENFNDSGNGYASYSSGTSANLGGYIDQVQGGTETGFIIKSKNGSETTHYCDYGYLDSVRVARFGGNHSDGSNAGAFLLQFYASASHSYAYVSARLMYL